MSVFASGAIPPREAIEWVCAQPNIESIVFGASSARNIQPHPRTGGAPLGARAAARGGGELTTLLVASTGGHLKQLHRLHRRLVGIDGPFRWATFDTPQSRSLLDGETVDFVHFVGGRDPGNVMRNVPLANAILRRHEVDTIVSTGSAVALPFFALARARGLNCHYIESAARSDGPSKTAGMIGRIPGVNLYAQYPAWAAGRWNYRGAVFDSFVPAERPAARPAQVRKVVVSLGTFKDYGFERLVRRLLEILPADAEVLWQTGDTDVSGLGIVGHNAIPERELDPRRSGRPTCWSPTPAWGPRWPRSRSASARCWCRAGLHTASMSTITRPRSPASCIAAISRYRSTPTSSRSSTCSTPPAAGGRRCPWIRRSSRSAPRRPPRPGRRPVLDEIQEAA